jgi:hypothetical protein
LGIDVSEKQMVHSRLDPARAYYAGITWIFLRRGELLGDKVYLERHICEITGIPVKALRGSPLSDFNIIERMSWVESRETACREVENGRFGLARHFEKAMEWPTYCL